MSTQQNEPTLSLTDIAGINMTEVAEVRFELLPMLVGTFEVDECKFEMNTQTPPVPQIILSCKVMTVESVAGTDPKTGQPYDKDGLVGKTQKQSFNIKQVEDLGRFKSFCVDAGVEFAPDSVVTVQELVDGVKGLQFPGRITHRPSRNDPDIKFGGVQPIVQKAA